MTPDMSVWTGRDDTADEGTGARRWHQCVQPWMADAKPGLALLGFACDEGVRRNGGRVGAREGPHALRQALANLAWHQQAPVYDAGDVTCAGEDLEGAQQLLANSVTEFIRGGQHPLILGGGHETAWATASALFRARPDAVIGIINFDAHFDLRESPQSHSGTSFRQIANWCREQGRPFNYLVMGIAKPANTIALFDQARALTVSWSIDADLNSWRVDRAVEKVRGFLRGCDAVYLSVDLDVLPAAVMPAVSAPAVRGVALEVIEHLIAEVVQSGQLAAADVVEFNPVYDAAGTAARVAAGLVWRVAHAWRS